VGYKKKNMSNYLRGLGRAVGFAEDQDQRRTQGMGEQRGDTEWEAVSHTSSRGEVNILRGATRGTGPGLGGIPPRGGGCLAHPTGTATAMGRGRGQCSQGNHAE
jgi:hypothetical protein